MSASFVVRPRRAAAAVPGKSTDAASRPVPPASSAAPRVPVPFSHERAPEAAAAVPAASAWVPERRRSAEHAGPSRAATPSPDVARPAAEEPCAQWHPALTPFAACLADPQVTDIFVNGAAGMFVDRGAGAVAARGWHATEEEVRTLAVDLIGAGGRHLDDAAPCVDVRLDGGVRVHAVLPPVAPEGTMISIRVPRIGRPTLDALEGAGMFAPPVRRRLEQAIAHRVNLLVTGAAGAGKTTLLAALLAETPAHERIVTIEDVAELRIAHPHHVRLEARQPNIEGSGAIGLARLVREALRMRPDRLVVGECRGEEVRELLSALNTGHDGGAGTVHANSLGDVPARLEALGALAGLDDQALARQTASAIGLIVHVERDADGKRRIAGAGRPVVDSAGRLGIEEQAWDADG
ncbi:TadA family conjugal transfer-associated ATPase [Microbacterium atlanticum]|uniref:TadA family conjugal transfer-associated ATPase n=1 Tax=Microbacterium atlanticum TaxID=2782168 RepID=UPI003080D50F